jgi:hypothetical protein
MMKTEDLLTSVLSKEKRFTQLNKINNTLTTDLYVKGTSCAALPR